MAQPDVDIDIETARAKALVDNARRLGLTWDLIPATITLDGDPSLQGILDGDSAPIGLVSMVGSVATGDRVYVMRVPPAGNFIVGVINPPPVNVGWEVLTANTGFVSAEQGLIQTANPVTFKAGCAYRIDFEVDVESNASNGFVNLQIRRTSISGTVLRANSGHVLNVGTTGFGVTCKGSGIVRNLTTADVVDILLLTGTSFIAGQVRVVAATNRLAYIEVTYIGRADEFPNATAL